MKNYLRKITSIALVMTMAVSLGACGKAQNKNTSGEDASVTEAPATTKAAGDSNVISDKKATLTMMSYYDGKEDPLNNYAMSKVKESFPNVTIDIETEPQDGGQTIKTRAATGDLPDILLADSGTITILAESGSIIPLDDYIQKTNYKDKLVTGAVQTCLTSPDGHIYEFPIGGVSPILWYYNKTVFEQAGVQVPTNYDELLQVVKTFREKGITPMAMFGKEPWPLGALYDSFALKNNPKGIYALSLGETKASDESYKNATQKIAELVKAGIFQEGSTNADFDTASAVFEEGKCAMFLNGSWYITDANEALGDKLGVFETYPTADKGKEDTNKYSMAGGGDTCGLTITSNAKDPDLTAQVAAVYAYNREIAEYQVNNSVTVPVKTDGIQTNSPLCAASQELLGMIPNLTYDSKFLHTLSNTAFATSFTEEMQKLLVGETADDFTANVDKTINKTTKQ